MKKVFVLFSLWICLAPIATSNVVAEQEKGPDFKSDFAGTTEPVYFSGDRFEYDRNNGIITGTGNIIIIQNDSQLRGGKVVIDLQKQIAEIEQNVVITRPGETAQGDSGVANAY